MYFKLFRKLCDVIIIIKKKNREKKDPKKRIAPGGTKPGAAGIKGPHATTVPRQHIHLPGLQLSIWISETHY